MSTGDANRDTVFNRDCSLEVLVETGTDLVSGRTTGLGAMSVSGLWGSEISLTWSTGTGRDNKTPVESMRRSVLALVIATTE